MLGIKVHSCDEYRKLHGYDPHFHVTIKEDNSSWTMTVIRNVSEKEVVFGEAMAIGEEMTNFMMVISFCPFCGESFGVKC